MDRDCMSRDELSKGRLRPSVGDPWPDELDVHVERVPDRSQMISGVGALFGALLIAFAAFGMITLNQPILDKVFELVKYGVIAFVSWTIGRRGS